MTPGKCRNEQNIFGYGKTLRRHAFKDKLNDLGYINVTDDVIQEAFGKFKVLADKNMFMMRILLL